MRLLAVHPGADSSTSDVYDGMVPALERLGVECVPYRLDVRIYRAGGWLKWNWEKAGKPDPRPTQADIIYQASVGVIERALRLQPDWVFIFSAMFLHPDVLIMLRRAGIRTAVMLSESPYDSTAEAKILPFVDLAWTNERSCVADYRRINPNTHYLAHAFDPKRHSPVADGDNDDQTPAHDVVFVGTGFEERIEVLSAVDWTGIDFGLYGYWSMLPSRHRLRKYLRGGVTDNARAAALYRRAKIGLNIHRLSIGHGRAAPRIQHAESLNPRAYELAACGVFQISDARAEVSQLFSWSVPTFGDASELEKRIRYFLKSPHERSFKADAARALVQRQTFDVRALQVLGDLQRSTELLAA